MERQKLHVWRPSANILREYTVNDCARYNENGFVITLSDIYGTTLEIVYDRYSQIIGDYIWAFRYKNEIPQPGYLVHLMEEARKEDNDVENFDPYKITFYKMINSDFIKEMGFESMKDAPKLEHHLYPFYEGIFEVISEYEPKVILKNKKDKN